ncbi:caspase family protein [Sphingomonas sp. AP4-R1]|uniref:caspase family protein n=1 Tax=Sphingomonas sp. AP4-R1 TaxID=2735134 RepID=UPI0014934547|nr:caspase family protein [Sphingomonas sp. AP4-R1]QJU56457.1 caspase family protein [Sphingomonas sp. AP4-R1]
MRSSLRPFLLPFLLLMLAVLAVLAPAERAAAEVKALIVTGSYQTAASPSLRLANPVVDGREIALALTRAGIRQIALVEDPDAAHWSEALDRFVGSLGKSDIALVYYAGHGLQVGGINYFLAGDGKTLLSVDAIVQQISSKAGSSLFVIDACRNNPFQKNAAIGEQTIASRAAVGISMAQVAASGQGLAQLGELTGLSTVILFSTEPGNVALDGPAGAGSPFAHAFAAEIVRRQSLDVTLRRTAVAVQRATEGAQSPWRQGDLARAVYIAGMPSFPVP